MFKNLILLSICCLFYITPINAQTEYTDDEDRTHLWGTFKLAALENEPYGEWYQENYDQFTADLSQVKWAQSLNDYQVDIYIGTWCGDSKKWVPQFVKMWASLGLNQDQLNFIGLRNGTEFYKQGPNGEEKGVGIHRVPTFVFKKDGTEQARIVESPINDLVTDVQQIAMGCPSKPRYRGVQVFQDQFAKEPIDSLVAQPRPLIRAIYRELVGPSELNTYGYVLKSAGEMEKALLVFRINKFLNKFTPNVHDSLGEQYFDMEDFEAAKTCYEKVLELKKEDENALAMLEKIDQHMAELTTDEDEK